MSIDAALSSHWQGALLRWRQHVPPQARTAWDALAAVDAAAPVFNHRTWLELAYGQRVIAPAGLFIAWQDDRPIGLFPLERRLLWSWRLVNSFALDDLQVLIDLEQEDAAWQALAGWVRALPGAACLTLGVCSNEARVARFTAACRQQGVIPLVTPDPSPVVLCSLPDSWEALLASLDAQARKNIRKAERLLAQDYPEAEVAMLTDPAACRQALDEMIGLFRRRWGERGGGCIFDPPRNRTFYQQAVEWAVRQGHAAVAVLRAAGSTQVVMTLFRSPDGGMLSAQLVARDLTAIKPRYGTGIVLLCHVMRYAIAHGARVVNLGQGVRPYKLLFNGRPHPRWHLAIARTPLGAALLPPIDRLLHKATRAPVYARNYLKGLRSFRTSAEDERPV